MPESSSETPVPSSPPSTTAESMEAAFAAALKEEGLVPPPAAPSPAPSPAPLTTSDPDPKVEDGLTKLARKSAELRQQQQKVQPVIGALEGLPPGTAQALAKAIASKDPVSVLSALGFTHKEYESAAIERPEAPPPPDPVQAEIRALKEQIAAMQQDRAEAYREKAQARMKAAIEAKASEFKYLTQVGELAQVENVILDFHQRYGRLPGDTFEESVLLAAEEVESRLAKEAQRWGKVLTPAPVASNIPTAKAPEASPAPRAAPLTNRTASEPGATPKQSLQTKEDRLSALENDPEFQRLLNS